MGSGEVRARKATSERRQALAAHLAATGDVTSIEDLASLYQVSTSTIRRDLQSLASSGELVRTYGGAAPTARSEFGWNRKGLEFAGQKRDIATFARDNLIGPEDTVFVDSGTTAAEVARQVADWSGLTILVGGLSALIALADGKADVHVIGGHLRRPSASFLGVSALLDATSIQPDVAFLGCESVDPRKGLNSADFEQSKFKALIMQNALRTWVVIDESKLRGLAPFSFWAPLSLTTGFIVPKTTNPVSLDLITELRSVGHAVHEV